MNQTTSIDPLLPNVSDDPRITSNGRKLVKLHGGGRNTVSFDPKSTLVRPDMRIIVGKATPKIDRVLKHDDVLVIPNFFCEEDDWSIYYKLIEEMRELQASKVQDSNWISWAEGAHLISKNPQGSHTFDVLQKKICDYFEISDKTASTRFNWYRDSSDWKPFHHDSAAFNAERARKQNITIGISFGSTRELAFLNASNNTSIYFPQTNGMLFAFGRDVNIRWKHGVNALPAEEQDGRGRISIILWGWCKGVKDEAGSPAILNDNTRGNGYNMHQARHSNPQEQQYENNNRGGGKNEYCRDFEKGVCQRGDRCRWLHREPHRDISRHDRENSYRRNRSRSRSRSYSPNSSRYPRGPPQSASDKYYERSRRF